MTAAALLICALFVARLGVIAGNDFRDASPDIQQGMRAVALLSIVVALALAFLGGWLAAS